ncbi:hypothetical protein FPQ18DRAFT_352140 [Pyronema domesticum]|uniref:Uncharacterized protein n=1 Tax=Pyronema omphalodes (strain CBS 100304) TaxID=1076935 RepID=U4L6Z6_PYROM|nr:hypothetical protein FPQ18DRAFT_352140 [Pyronema domesticum]CCX08383.1 Similar to hypothetical protein PIIN_09350 [Piriformospora indica DSM 11827]; acc. no. CCA75366 [Pyronema omphalodes CBS 100304]
MHRSTPPPLPPRNSRPPPLPPRPKNTPPPIPISTRPPPTPPRSPSVLSQEQINTFLTHGYVRIPAAFSPEKAASWSSNVWSRLGCSPVDQSTWKKERIHLPPQNREHVRTFSPIAWQAMCALLGGEDRIDDANAFWSDAFIVNLGVPGSVPDHSGKNDGAKLWDWHVDGDFFVHFLDSREQGLLVIPIFSDIEEGGGGTMIAPDGISIISKYLYDHPEGVQPSFGGGGWFVQRARECETFVEMTGKAGDVILMHPFMLHSASRNYTRAHRVITNPRIGLKKPFTYGRDGSQLSLVERKTLMSLGLEGEKLDWNITGQRKGIVPDRMKK